MRHLSKRIGRAAAIAAISALCLGAAPAPQIAWEPIDVAMLLRSIEDTRHEGLTPGDYDAASIRRAQAAGDRAAIDAAATRGALRLAKDFAQGRVGRADRVGWHIQGPAAAPETLAALVGRATQRDELATALWGLLPRHPEYRALREALAQTSDAARREQLRVNMERWRWMPRDLGTRHILVNVPGFSLKLVDGDTVVDERPVIVGKPSTPTPQFGGEVSAVILNPWWEVPKSIVAESVGPLLKRDPAGAKAKGYVMQPTGAGIRVRQAPGPSNALGQMKLVMPNPFSVYLHDTPAKGKFDEPVRAFSHGCVRVKGAIDFAALLLENDPAWNRQQIDRTLAAGKSVKAPLARSVPVWISYFTAATDAKGRLAYFADPYGRDARVARALGGEAPLQVAARAATETCAA
jgi:murein L,D-transpeptidase YcbB/YkuD